MSERMKHIFITLDDNDENEIFLDLEDIDYDSLNTNLTSEPDFYNVYSKVFLVLIYACVFFMSLLGNSLLLWIIYRTKRMKTVNNFFLANILVSNLLYTLCAPFPFIIEIIEKNDEWVFHEILCPIVPIMNTISINLNTFTMIGSALERLIVIIYPFKTKLSKKNCFIIILLIWFVSILLALPWSFLIHVRHDVYISKEAKICVPKGFEEKQIRAYFTILCVLQYIFPLVVLVITCIIITYYINVINARNIEKDANKSNNHLRKKNESKLLKTQILMIICFNVCWFPLQVNALIFSINPKLYLELISPKTTKYVWMCSHWLAFSHFCLNPILTGTLNKKFRVEILNLLKVKGRNLITSTTQNNLTNLAIKYRRNLAKSNESAFKNKNAKVSSSISINENLSRYKIVSMPIIFVHKEIESTSTLFKLKSYDDITLSIFDNHSCFKQNTNNITDSNASLSSFKSYFISRNKQYL